MRILLAIHSIDLNTPEFYDYMEKQLRQDPKTFLLFLGMRNVDRQLLGPLRKRFRESKDNFFYISSRKKDGAMGNFADFATYKASFSRVLKKLQEKCGSRERVEVISFGGAATVCYKDISLPAHKAIWKAFEGRKIRSTTFLPLVYGRKKLKKSTLRTLFGKIRRRK